MHLCIEWYFWEKITCFIVNLDCLWIECNNDASCGFQSCKNAMFESHSTWKSIAFWWQSTWKCQCLNFHFRNWLPMTMNKRMLHFYGCQWAPLFFICWKCEQIQQQISNVHGNVSTGTKKKEIEIKESTNKTTCNAISHVVCTLFKVLDETCDCKHAVHS